MADAGGFSDTEAGPSHSSGAAAAAAAAAAEEAAARVSLLDVVIEEYNQHKDARTSRLLYDHRCTRISERITEVAGRSSDSRITGERCRRAGLSLWLSPLPV